jgi:Holliday junction resolvasome RuvABC endonuclease subunit
MRQFKYVAFDAALANTGGHWGYIDENGIHPVGGFLYQTVKTKDKKKQAVMDFIDRCEYLCRTTGTLVSSIQPDFIFFESPVGSQSSKAAQGAAAICMLIAAMKVGTDAQVITSTPSEVKKATGLPGTPEKREIIDWAYIRYPTVPWTWHAGRIKNDNEHMADSLAVALAGHKKITEWEK